MLCVVAHKRGATIRAGIAFESEVVGSVAAGGEVEVDESCVAVARDLKRVRVVSPAAGWVTLKLLRRKHRIRRKDTEDEWVPAPCPSTVSPVTGLAYAPHDVDDDDEAAPFTRGRRRLEGRSLALLAEMEAADKEERRLAAVRGEALALEALRAEIPRAPEWVFRAAPSAPKTPLVPPPPATDDDRFVSVVTPTTRARPHEQLYRCFAAQTHHRRELVVLGDGCPSPFFANLEDPRVRYFAGTKDRTLGAKRRWLCEQARGEVVANMDDDDLYEPTYLARMLAALGSTGDLAKLASFHFVRTDDDRRLRMYDADADRGVGAHLRRWGYGFTFVMSRRLVDAVPYASDLDVGEDYDLAVRAIDMGLRCASFADTTTGKIAVHVRHATNAIYFGSPPILSLAQGLLSCSRVEEASFSFG
ncbi:hypothetical protein CTAYLR_000046 [Chrysophaeum taylorii]|uniref:Glycosyltransferase 2-like domain-containing protein n=1 Tax=Chrysophaeum taylorii TaxID=2483200 RepID=A0AAD7UGG9_9STRA|nr:hypothetical protein CTAYLR_000046 [Chrysophaeum taylorii]